MTSKEHSNQESFKVSADELLSRLKEIIKEGNARKVIIKNEKEETIMEFPLTIGAIGIVLAPLFAAVGAIAAFATDCIVVIEKREVQEK
jgi:hypothetical protein